MVDNDSRKDLRIYPHLNQRPKSLSVKDLADLRAKLPKSHELLTSGKIRKIEYRNILTFIREAAGLRTAVAQIPGRK
jgi:hypothetical protein